MMIEINGRTSVVPSLASLKPETQGQCEPSHSQNTSPEWPTIPPSGMFARRCVRGCAATQIADWLDKLMRDALALELHQEVKLTSGEKVKKLRLVARTLVDNAIDGDTTAARECFDRMDGKVTQSADAT